MTDNVEVSAQALLNVVRAASHTVITQTKASADLNELKSVFSDRELITGELESRLEVVIIEDDSDEPDADEELEQQVVDYLFANRMSKMRDFFDGDNPDRDDVLTYFGSLTVGEQVCIMSAAMNENGCD